MEEIFKSKYHRKEPVRKFDVHQTLYDAVMNTNENNMNYKYANFMGMSKNYKYLKKQSDKLATALHRDGIKDGDRIGVCLITVPEVDTALLAINKLGAQSFWLDASVKADDMLKYINQNNLKELIISSPLLPMIDEIIDQTNLQRVILVSPINFLLPIASKFKTYENEKYIDFAKFISVENDKTIKPAKYDKEKPTIIVQSSGSTGKAKSIVHTDYNFNSEVQNMAYLDFPFYEKKKAFVCAPPWVIYGLCNSIYTGLIYGVETVFSLKPEEDMIYKNISNFDYSFGVPVYYRYLYNKILELESSNNKKDKKELEKIMRILDKKELFISGGDKVAEEELINWQHKFRTIVANGYGNNEVVGAAIVSPMFANKPGSIGISMHGVESKAFDENGKIINDESVGELYISSDNMFKEYLNNPEETQKIKINAEGKEWVKTGDLAYIDKDGFIYLKGRTRRLIIDKLGYKISPDNAENFIQSLEYVKQCVVVGGEVGANDMVPYAFVELNDEYKNNNEVIKIIEEECLKHFKDYERPKYIKEIEKIPHKENGGKVDFLLLEQLAKDNINSKKRVLNK